MDTTTGTGVGFAEGKAYARIVHCLQTGVRQVTELDDTAFGPLNNVTIEVICPIHTQYHPALNIRVEVSIKDILKDGFGRRPEGWQETAGQRALGLAGPILDAYLSGSRPEIRG